MCWVNIATPFDILEAAPISMATLVHQPELYAFALACTLSEGKTANIYTDGVAFGVAHGFGVLWKQ